MEEKQPNHSETEILTLMKEIRNSHEEEVQLLKKQLCHSRIVNWVSLTVLVCVLGAMLFAAFQLGPAVENTVASLEVATRELAEADLPKMLKDVDSLVQQGGQSITEAMDKLNQVDFDTLNGAIEHLNSVLKPFADFFGR